MAQALEQPDPDRSLSRPTYRVWYPAGQFVGTAVAVYGCSYARSPLWKADKHLTHPTGARTLAPDRHVRLLVMSGVARDAQWACRCERRVPSVHRSCLTLVFLVISLGDLQIFSDRLHP